MLNTYVKTVGEVPDKVNKEYINKLSQIKSVTDYYNKNTFNPKMCISH